MSEFFVVVRGIDDKESVEFKDNDVCVIKKQSQMKQIVKKGLFIQTSYQTLIELWMV